MNLKEGSYGAFDMSHDEQSALTTGPAQDVMRGAGKTFGGVGKQSSHLGCSVAYELFSQVEVLAWVLKSFKISFQ